MGSSFVESGLCSLNASHGTGGTSQTFGEMFIWRKRAEKSLLTPQEGKGHMVGGQRNGHTQISPSFLVNYLCHPVHLLDKMYL